ncbi:peroxisome biogenesis factor 10 [Halocaridina rubra]|uniref:RING-type E3 ubiquitin transferase n=1 Tax=Halocaridina rubra TaxID=373956 RepID=A0AAN9A3S5_HALRR
MKTSKCQKLFNCTKKMPFTQAGAAEVLRASQKDESFLSHLKSSLAEIVQRSLGTKVWLDIHKYAEILCEVFYYGLTTLSLRQTLGEEYTGIIQVDHSRRRLPSLLERTSMVILQCFGPEVLRRGLSKFEKSVRNGHLSTYFRPELKNFILQHMPTLIYSLAFLHRLHLATFYFNGGFYHISKRVAGIKYVLIREWLGDSTASRSFQILGSVLFLHIILTLMYSGYTHYFTKPAAEKRSVSNCYVDNKKQCPLCLDERQNSSVTPCGHLFCWQCIHECLQTTQQCPLCRHKTLPSQDEMNFLPHTSKKKKLSRAEM